MSLSDAFLRTNFAALRVLQYVHDFGSFSVAAERLDVAQSTVSYTVERLRKVFNDPLFVREGNRVAPTPRCESVVGSVADLLSRLEGLAAEPAFSPAHARGSVTISCNHYERQTILPLFIRRVRQAAPNLRLRFITSSAVGDEQLKRGDCDMLLGPVQLAGQHLFKRHVRQDAYTYVMDRSNPLSRQPLTLNDLKAAKHLIVQFTGDWQPLYLNAFKMHGLHLNPMVETSDYGDVASYISGSDLVICMPRLLARPLAPRLALVEPPLHVPLNIDLFWTSRTHRSKLHNWARSMLVDCAQTMAQGGPKPSVDPPG